jgi:hypothetical protein
MKIILAFALAVAIFQASPCSADTHANWQCGRDYIVGTGLYGLIYRNQTGPHGDAEDVWLNPGPPIASPAWERMQSCKTDKCFRRYRNKDYLWENYGRVSADKGDGANRGRLYYRGKPCKEMPALVLSTNASRALEFSRHGADSSELNAIAATGRIAAGDSEKLLRYLRTLPGKPNTAIYLSSPGGSLSEGLKLGYLFKEMSIKTVVEGIVQIICAQALARWRFWAATILKGDLGGPARRAACWVTTSSTAVMVNNAGTSRPLFRRYCGLGET